MINLIPCIRILENLNKIHPEYTGCCTILRVSKQENDVCLTAPLKNLKSYMVLLYCAKQSHKIWKISIVWLIVSVTDAWMDGLRHLVLSCGVIGTKQYLHLGKALLTSSSPVVESTKGWKTGNEKTRLWKKNKVKIKYLFQSCTENVF